MDWCDNWLLSSTSFLKQNLWFIIDGDCFIRVSKHEKTDERTRQRAECFYCIRVFRNPDETRSPSLWNGFSKGSNLLAINTKGKQGSCLHLFFVFFLFLSNEIIEITMRIKCTTNNTLKHTNKNNQSAIHEQRRVCIAL